MTVTFVLSVRCGLCGYISRGAASQPVRVNQRTLRGTADGLWMVPRRCRECGALLGDAAPTIHLTPDSVERVAAYRRRKGWAA